MTFRTRRFLRQRHVESDLELLLRRDARRKHDDDNLDIPRCPICGHRLVVRQDCQGPYFFCMCVGQRKAA